MYGDLGAKNGVVSISGDAIFVHMDRGKSPAGTSDKN